MVELPSVPSEPVLSFTDFRWLVHSFPKVGKALALDTPIPTPDGWEQMGDLMKGDIVFDDNGLPCTVLEAFPPMTGRKCYRLVFSDGSSIVADSEHLWETKTRNPRGAISVKSTEQIRQTLVDEGRTNHHLSTAGEPLECLEKDLPIEPYVLGAWLGDGSSTAARLHFSEKDSEIVENIQLLGTRIGRVRKSRTCSYVTLGCALPAQGKRQASPQKPCLQKDLRGLGLLGNKHIPKIYLRSAISQRVRLLQGLMDTDGYCSEKGLCEFSTTKAALRDDFLELAYSLGLEPDCDTRPALLYGKNCGKYYRIRFRPRRQIPPFRLSRKLRRVKNRESLMKPRLRRIVSVDEVPSVPVRCIQVDSANRLYLAGKGMIPTHNTTLFSFLPGALYLKLEEGTKGLRVYGVDIRNWGDMCDAVTKLEEGDHKFTTVIIDPIESAYKRLAEQVAVEAGVPHISHLKYGQGWDDCNRRLNSLLDHFYIDMKMGVILLSHSRVVSIAKGPVEQSRIVPDLSDGARRAILGWVDQTVYLELQEEGGDEDHVGTFNRVAVCQPTPYIEAGGRLHNMPERIELPSPREGYDNLRSAFEEAAAKFVAELAEETKEKKE